MPTPRPSVRALVLADTHLTAETIGRMPAEVWDLATAADIVLHAGDVTEQAVLDALGTRAPVEAVLGNNDGPLAQRLPIDRHLVLGGVAVAIVHDAGPTAGRSRRMARRFPGSDLVIFGHSHQPVREDAVDGPFLFNPGSPTHRRRQPVHTVGWLELGDGRIHSAEIREVGPLAAPRTAD